MARRAILAGHAICAMVALVMIADGLIGLLRPQVFAGAMIADGWPADRMPLIAVVALASGLLFAIPRTALLGAILLTGYLGAAIATHLRVTSEIIAPEIVCAVLALAAWGGLWLRDRRVRALLPISS